MATKKIKDQSGELLYKIGQFLKDNGYKVVVIGGISVRQYPFGLKNKFEFVCEFIGRKLK